MGATIQQRAAVEKMVEFGRKGKRVSVSRAMRESKYPYSPKTAVDPGKLTRSKGFQELCEEYGLTDDFLIKALVDDIKKKPTNRKAELELGFKVKQRLTESSNTFNQFNVFATLKDDQINTIARRIAKRGIGHGATSSPERVDLLPNSNQPQIPTELAP